MTDVLFLSIFGTLYRNKKTGRTYQIVAMGTDCTNSRDGTEVVIYHDVEHEYGAQTFVREAKEFFNKFERVEW